MQYSLTQSHLEWNEAALEGVLAERFEAVARVCASRVAVVDAANSLTYAGLEQASRQIANAILARRSIAAEPVVVLAGHATEAVAGLLGALRAGKFYSVLNPDLPEKRLEMAIQSLFERPTVAGLAQEIERVHRLESNIGKREEGEL
jgi:non-ribosomal peptide synthetase component F